MAQRWTDSPRYRPDRDKRLRDPRRILHDKLQEADAMIKVWERSHARDAAEQLHC
jgi:hypothetical protein